MKPVRTVTAPTPNFTGREDLIAKIHRQIQTCSEEKEHFRKLVVAHGLGGIEKSELVHKCVHEYRQDPVKRSPAWIDAESKNSLESRVKSLAQKFDPQTKEKEFNDVLSSIYKHLVEHNQPSKFIFDNAQQMRSEGYIPHTNTVSSLQGIQTITGNESVAAGRDANIHINIHPTPNHTAASKQRVWKPFRTVTTPTPNFSGREDLIATIHRQIQKCSNEKEIFKKIVVIQGLGGMRKSELVRKYVQEYRQDPITFNTAWIDAESKNSLESSFKSLAQELDLKTRGKEFKDVVSSVYKHLAKHNQPSLFIFDNAEQMRSEGKYFGIFDFLPTAQLDTLLLIIITTRFKDWEIPEENILQINELSEEAAVNFFTKRWSLSTEQTHDSQIMDALKDLARSLQCFPLCLTLSASNIPHSTLRSIPKEIKEYIQKLNAPHEDWILQKHSAGIASKYDLIMSNVWAATLEKIQSHGQDGEAAIAILNIMAYLQPDEISVKAVRTVAEFSRLATRTESFEMLEKYSLISLPSSTNDRGYQLIRIYRLVQRCTRDKLDRGNNYTFLLNISMFTADEGYVYFAPRPIHQHLKERTWPENSFEISILFASVYGNWHDTIAILKDVHEVLVLKEKPANAQNLKEDYKILHALNLFRMSSSSKGDTKLCVDWISKDPFYSENYLEQVFVSSLGKCVKDLFMGTMDRKNLVKRDSMDVLVETLRIHRLHPTLSKESHKEIPFVLADATSSSFQGSEEIVEMLYRLVWDIFWTFTSLFGRWCVESVLKIHSGVYASISATGGDLLDKYWERDQPIPFFDILRDVKKDSNAERNRLLGALAELFRTQAGLQFLLQHLQYVDALTQTKKFSVYSNAACVLEFIMLLGWRWDCTKEFVQANLIMETLYSITRNVFKWNAKEFYWQQFICLMAWFGLFGKTTCVDRNDVSWSIQSVEKEMILFLESPDQLRWRLYASVPLEAEAILKEFIESSGSDQERNAVKTAKRMLSWL